jgi:hypothetical protein
MKIVRTRRYLKDMQRVGATERDIARLEETIAANPTTGDVMPGLHGLRKVRFALGGRGKRGGGRAIYFLIVSDDTVIMLFAYAKSEQENLTPDQRRAVLALLKEITDG